MISNKDFGMFKLVLIPFVIMASVVVSAVLSLPVMFLWDSVVTQVFGMKEITWMQAWGLTLLCGLLFKSNVETKA